jgi:cytochrome P450/NADPH-cytochrome P450 reductase
MRSKDKEKPKDNLTILYGSSAGTCKYLAEDLEMSAKEIGFGVNVQTMDSATEHVPKDDAVIIITPFYEGKPADNAKNFVAWLEASSGDALKDTNFAVFGAGNSEWTSTFHRIPKLVNERMESLGGKGVHYADYVDVREDLVGPWEDWKEALLGKIAGGSTALTPSKELKVEIWKPDSADKLAGAEVSTGIVRKSENLSDTSVGPRSIILK